MKDYGIAVGRVFLLAALLALLPAPVKSQADSTTVQVVRVIDGDTIQVCCVFGDRVTVRYVGIDTPEIHHPMKGVERAGKEASEANRKLVDGKSVRLEFDVQQRPYEYWGMHPFGGAWGIGMMLMMLIFWGLVVVALVLGPSSRPDPSPLQNRDGYPSDK